MKKLTLYTILLLTSVSCTISDDFDILGLGNRNLDTFSSFVLENSTLLQNNNVVSVGTKEISINSINLSSFLNDDYDCFPVYSTDFKTFHLVNWSFFKSDTVAIHYKGEYIIHYVDSILSSDNDLKVVENTWRKDNKLFKTLSLIDKTTGDLLYDNFVFNFFRNEIHLNSSKRLLTRAESPVVGNVEYISISNSEIVANGTMSWSIDGRFEKFIHPTTGQEYYIFFADIPQIHTTWNVTQNLTGYELIKIADVTTYLGSYNHPTSYVVRMGIGSYPYFDVPYATSNNTPVFGNSYGMGASYYGEITK